MLTPLANSLSSLAVQLVGGATDRARELIDEVIEIRRSLGDRGGLADTLVTVTRVALAEGDVAAAGAAGSESLALSRQTGDQEGIAAAVEGARGHGRRPRGDRGGRPAARRSCRTPPPDRSAAGPIDLAFAEQTLEPARQRCRRRPSMRRGREGDALSIDEVQPKADTGP